MRGFEVAGAWTSVLESRVKNVTLLLNEPGLKEEKDRWSVSVEARVARYTP